MTRLSDPRLSDPSFGNEGASEREAARHALLEAAREMDRAGLTEGTAGNLSMRCGPGEILVTPSALAYSGMQPSDLVVLDLDGRVVEGHRPPTTEAALHLACLRRHRDIAAVVHSHAVHATMFAVAQRPIPAWVEEFELYVGGDVPVAPYRPTGTDALGEIVAEHLTDRAAVLLANHGLVTVGRTPAEALAITKLVDRTARIVAGAERIGTPAPLPRDAREALAARYRQMRAAPPTRPPADD